MFSWPAVVVVPSLVVADVDVVPSSPPEKTPAIARIAKIRITPIAARAAISFVWRLDEPAAGRSAAAPVTPGSAGASLGSGRAARRRLPRGSGRFGCLACGGDLAQARLDPLGQLERVGVALQVADGIGTADRIGLAEQVVGQRHVPVGVGTAELRERRTGLVANLALLNPEQAGDVLVALAALA